MVGDDGVISEGKAISTHYLPAEVGLRRQSVEYTCVDASQQFLAVGSAQGYVWVIELHSSRLLREFSVSWMRYLSINGPPEHDKVVSGAR